MAAGVSHSQLFLTCSLDGSIKLFDDQKRLVQGMALEAPITCCAFLNNQGDIIAGGFRGERLRLGFSLGRWPTPPLPQTRYYFVCAAALTHSFQRC